MESQTWGGACFHSPYWTDHTVPAYVPLSVIVLFSRGEKSQPSPGGPGSVASWAGAAGGFELGLCRSLDLAWQVGRTYEVLYCTEEE